MNRRRLVANIRKTLLRGNVVAHRLDLVPETLLYLFDSTVLSGPLSHEEAQAVVAEPAYWSFCWASGQALARFILDNPDNVKGKEVIDVGSGSGVVAIACKLAGAARVTAYDIDPWALEAVTANAELNGVEIELADQLPEEYSAEVITAADILYDRDNLPLLENFLLFSQLVLLADSRMRHMQFTGYRLAQTKTAETFPDLNEFEEFNTVRIFVGK